MLLLMLLLVHFVVGVPDEEVVEREEDGDEGDANAVGDHCEHAYQLLVGLGLVQLLNEILQISFKPLFDLVSSSSGKLPYNSQK